jgi:hypothetical protein
VISNAQYVSVLSIHPFSIFLETELSRIHTIMDEDSFALNLRKRLQQSFPIRIGRQNNLI